MCRLFAFASAAPQTVADVMGPANVAEFTDLSRLHGDGWGAAWLGGRDDASVLMDGTVTAVRDGVGEVARVRSTRAAWDDPVFADFVRNDPGTAAIVHLRWASPGMAVMLDNQHPFLTAGDADGEDAAAFAHNGGIDWTPELTEEGRRQWAAAGREAPAWTGTTDSERYFWLVRAYHAAGADWPEACVRAHGAIRALAAPCGINAMLLTPTQIVALHAAGGRRPDLARWATLGVDTSALPRDHTDEYYRLAVRRSDHDVALVSSGLPLDGWEPIADETMVVVDRATLAVTISPLAGPEHPRRWSDPAGRPLAVPDGCLPSVVRGKTDEAPGPPVDPAA